MTGSWKLRCGSVAVSSDRNGSRSGIATLSRSVQMDLQISPLLAELNNSGLDLVAGVQHKECPWTVGGRPHCQTRHPDLAQPMIDFCVMAASPPGIVMVDYGASTIGQLLHLCEGHLLAELRPPPSPIGVIDDTIIRVCEYEIARG
ncbi:MAG: hypothetical protein ABJ201_08005 [Nisaea sp.]